MSAKKLYIKTHGCQMNEYDSDKIFDVLADSHGLEKAEKPENADILLLNTCSVREKAQEKVFSELGRWRPLKERNPGVVIGVGGCVASQEGGALRERAPFVDIVFGPQTLHRLPTMLDSVIKAKTPVVDISFPQIEKFDNLPEPRIQGSTAFVSIMEGCSKYCSFCVVPYTRGEEVSRPLDDVIAEIVRLTLKGVKEVTLLGQNVNAYRGVTFEGTICDFATLLYYVSAINGIERIRFTTSHPAEFSDELIRAYAEIPKLCDHLHLPVQSGSDRILAMMKRGYTALEYKAKIRALRRVRPNICISSDFIVGFPNESAADFDATMQLIADVGFDQSYSFVYSARPGTPAAAMVDTVPADIKKERLARLQATITANAQKISQGMLDSEQMVLVEGLSKKSAAHLSGRTENNRVVNFAGDPELIGQMVCLRITEVMPNSLRGQLLETAAPDKKSMACA